MLTYSNMRKRNYNIDLTKSDNEFFSDMQKNRYGSSMTTDQSSESQKSPNILKIPIKKSNKPITDSFSMTLSESSQDDQKYGIKRLLETKNRVTYPLNKQNNEPNIKVVETSSISTEAIQCNNIEFVPRTNDEYNNSECDYDIKKNNVIIDNMSNHVEEQTVEQNGPIMIKDHEEFSENNTSGYTPNTPEENTQMQLLMSKRNFDMNYKQESQPSDALNFAPLSVDNINASLEVLGDIEPGMKLKILDGMNLAVETSYITSVSRFNAGQGRNKIISFLEHMYNELVRNVKLILDEIRSNTNVDHNVSVLRGIICKLAVFLNKYENVRSVYKSDSSTYARLGNNRDKYNVFMDNFFRDVTIPK